MQGLWNGGQQTVGSSYISEVVEPKYKLLALTDIGIAALSGFITGPVLGYLLTYISVQIGAFRIDQYTSPGYFICLSNIVMIIVFVKCFSEVARASRHSFITAQTTLPKPPKLIGVGICVFIAFSTFYGFSVQETLTTPLVTDLDHIYTDNFDWSLNQAYLLYASSSLASMFAFAFIKMSSGKINDQFVLNSSLILSFVGWLLCVDWSPRVINHSFFLVGYILVGLTFPINRTHVINCLSQIIGPNPAGKYIGWILAIGGAAKCIGPFIAIYALQISPRLCFGIPAGLFLLAIVLANLGSKYLKKYEASKTV